ncbi:MAG: RNA methyltransferase [Pseudomonadota bacterium]|nr:RNA methyltransferase [Pseudomonadota bacterium]
MQPQAIRSKDNPKLRQVRGLLQQANQRRKTQQTVLEGVHLLDAYQRTGQQPVSIWLTQSALAHPEVNVLLTSWPQVACFILPDTLYQDLRSLGDGIDVLAVIAQPQAQLPDSITDDLLILENVQDAGNVGTLLRTAAAAGIRQVVCTTGTASVWSPRVLRAGMGAQFSLQIIEHLELAQLLPRLQVPLYATSSHATHSLYQADLCPPTAWLMGNEGQGATDLALQQAQAISIPQPGGQESLNVAIAGAICLFEMVRQRL